MGRLVDHQLTKLGLSADCPPDAATWRTFLDQVERAYREDEEDRQTLERTLSLSSSEMWRLHDGIVESEANFRAFLERAPDAMFLCRDTAILYANPAMAELLGYEDAAALVGLVPIETFVHTEDRAKLADFNTRRYAGESVGALEVRWVKRDGQVLFIRGLSTPATYGQQEATLTVCRDVTERLRAESDRRELEAQLRQAQKMEAIGQLAGGVAHDFNNILATILSYADLAAEDLGADHPVTPDLKQIGTAAKRAAALTRQLLAFSRQQASQTKALSLNKIVSGMEGMLRRLIGEDVSVTVDLSDGLDVIEADPGQMDQVLLNLAVNARDAMTGGGKLTLKTENVALDGPAAQGAGLTPGHYVMLAVTDTGCGMDAATQARIFEPFFTTKEIGKGTGLGLSTVYGIVKQSGGGISVGSEPGKGATFRVYFPRVASNAESIPAKALDLTRGSATVLLVEDEEQVRNVVQRLLTARGYEVVTAPSGAVALETLAARGGTIDLLLTDIVMPGMDGRTMATKALERHPRLKVLYMSGYTEHPTVKGAALGPADHFIQKPFTMQQMADAVRDALSGTSSTAA